jgi:CPA2 family monovalent cation:H+ antiporter-2
MLIVQTFDLDWNVALFIGLITALSSTAVVFKLLQDRSELTSNYGRTVLGILIFQDIVLVPLLLFVPLMVGDMPDFPWQIFMLALKALLIIGLVYAGNKWLMPRILRLIAHTKSQELFFMSILLVCLSVALLTAEFGMSLAFGAFLAGLMISESEYSHNVFGNIIPFKDTFTSFFFVSIGMLLNLDFVLENYLLVIATVVTIILLKMIVGMFCAFVLGHTLKGTILVGIALSQVGEFSFILAEIGLDYEIISSFYFQLFLATAIISMAISPFLIKVASQFADAVLKFPLPEFLVEGLFPLKQISVPNLKNHLVLIGKDSRALNLSTMAKHIKIPYISIVFDPAIARERQKKGETVIYGDAVNEPILYKAHVDHAKIVIISIGDMIPAMSVTEKVRRINKHAIILVRTKHVHDIEELYKLGADQVIPEEFETTINLFERVLRKYLLPRKEINQAIEKIRLDNYGIFRDKHAEIDFTFPRDMPNLDISAISIQSDSSLVKKSISELNFRKVYGVTVVAIKRQEKIIEHPDPDEVFRKDDIAYVLGKSDQVANVLDIFLTK